MRYYTVECAPSLVRPWYISTFTLLYLFFQVKWRFDSMKDADAQGLAVWKSPVPPLWWPLIEDFVEHSKKSLE